MEAMNREQSELTLGQAQERVLAGLADRWPSAPLRISEDKTVTCGFGWVFTLNVPFVGRASDRISGHPLPTLVLVDKRSTQVIATSKPFTAAQFEAVFERLLASSRLNGTHWCLTMTSHLEDFEYRGGRIIETARREGLVDITPGNQKGSI
jgi:hypothetical protein